jgi:hypothetical protein
MASAIFDILPGSIKFDNLYQTLLQYADKPLSVGLCHTISRQLAVRRSELGSSVIQACPAPVYNEWIPVEIYRMDKCSWMDGKPGVSISMYCLGSSVAGNMLVKRVPESWVSFLAYNIGFNRRLQYDYNPKQLIGLRIWSYVIPNPEKPDLMDFADWGIDPQMRKHNRAIILKRNRFEIEDDGSGNCSCPFDYEHYCHDCSKTSCDCIASIIRGMKYDQPIVWGSE